MLTQRASDTAPIAIQVRGSDGSTRTATLAIPDAAQRRQLTEPSALMGGLGLGFYEPSIPPVLGVVEPDGPAAHSGLKAGDTILAVNDSNVSDFKDVVKQIRTRAGQTVAI